MHISNVSFLNTYKYSSNNADKNEQSKKKQIKNAILKSAAVLTTLYASGVLIYRVQAVCKKPPRKTFEALLKEKELKFKDGIILNKNNEKFTGKLCRSTGQKGKTGYEMIETQRFKNGLITEKTYKDCFNNELEGKFYKDGILRADVSICAGKKLRPFSFYCYDKKGEFCEIGDGLTKGKESVFDIFRKKFNN